MLVGGVPICAGANSDDEMAAIFGRCTEIGKKYYVCPEYVLNFDSMLAYPCSSILKIEPHTHSGKSSPCIRITYGADTWDYMYFSDPFIRDRAMETILNSMQH